MEIYKPEFEKLVDVFTCQLCTKLFSNPVIMKCGHSFCSTCARDVMSKKSKGGGCSRCPLCLRAVKLGDCISNHLLGDAALCVNEIKEAISRGCSTAPRVTSDRDTGVGSEDTRSEASFVTVDFCSNMKPPPNMAPPKERYKSAFEKVVAVLTCPRCKNVFREPVILGCGHSFCLSCAADLESKVAGYWGCPLCGHKQRPHYYFNHQLNKAASVTNTMKAVISVGCSTSHRVTSDRDSGIGSEDAQSQVSNISGHSLASIAHPPNLAPGGALLYNFTMEQYKSAFEKVVDVLTCPRCNNLFRDPVILGCDHNFCKSCVADMKSKVEGDWRCPLCGRKQAPGYYVNRRLNEAALVTNAMKAVISAGCSTVPRVTSDRDSGTRSEDARSEVSSLACYSRTSMDNPPYMALFYCITEWHKPKFQKLVDVLTCQRCKTLFTDPVVMHCGHNVCMTCAGDILSKENEEGGSCRCPVCGAELRPESCICNHQLSKAALLVGIMKEGTGRWNGDPPTVTSDRASGV